MSRSYVVSNAIFGSVIIIGLFLFCGLLIYEGFIPILKDYSIENAMMAWISGTIFFLMIGLICGHIIGRFISDIREMWREALEIENAAN